MEISQSFCKLLFLPVTSCENFLAVLNVLAFQSNQLLHHFAGYLRCLLYAHVDFVYLQWLWEKTKWGLKPTSSSNVGPKQKRLRRVKLLAQSATELSGNHHNRMYCLSQNKILAAIQSKSRRINLFDRNIVENREVSKLLIESSGENSLLNKRHKLLMLQIGNKYPFDAWKKTFNRLKELTPFNALQITVIQ